jgi:hypothetical protein
VRSSVCTYMSRDVVRPIVLDVFLTLCVLYRCGATSAAREWVHVGTHAYLYICIGL